MITLAHIARILDRHAPLLLPPTDRMATAVALILRKGANGVDLLFVERAARQGDPWSGDIGFPGGRVDARDRDARAAAERETLEEIGLDLRTARPLGRLGDIEGAHLPVLVSCFAYAVSAPAPFRFDREIEDAFWVPLAELQAPERHVMAPVRFGGETFDRPAIRLPVAGKPVLWGITYRLVMEFFRLLATADGSGAD
jgi:8-oxo-dGTP pyrophosphatase MutT (NUDIX family)